MKQLILALSLIIGFHTISMAQDSKVKVDGSDYKKKVETKGTDHSAMFSPRSHRGYAVHYYARHRPVNRHAANGRHGYHSYVIHHRRHIHRTSVAHYKKVKAENKKGEYKAKT